MTSTLQVLAKLNEADLKELSVASLGHRKRLLEAIAERAAAAPSPTPVEPKASDTAERRQVTVMFSDLVGSTALSGRMDPEDLREVISAYQKCVAETVQRFGGSSRSTWATECWSISAIRKRTRTTLSERHARGWSWSKR